MTDIKPWYVTLHGDTWQPAPVEDAARALLTGYIAAAEPPLHRMAARALEWNEDRRYYEPSDLERAVIEVRAQRRVVYVPDDELDDFHAACARWLP